MPTIDRKRFFANIKGSPFPPKLTQQQVNGVNTILDEWERRALKDLRVLAYILATAFHETARTMTPIREYGSQSYLRGKKYWPWIGRGFVQLTWKDNYEAYQDEVLELFGADIIANPDAALRPDVAAYILFDGMLKGRFNGKKKGVEFYLCRDVPAWTEARRTVNVLDKAEAIAGIAKEFHSDLISAT